MRSRSCHEGSVHKLVTMLMLLATSLLGADLLVSNNNDSGVGSLRQAILDNNAGAGGNRIVFSNGVTGTIKLTSGNLAVTRFVSILGPGQSLLAIDGNQAGRIFHIGSTANLVSALIAGLTLTNGAVTGSFPGNVGGAIWNDHATLTISNCNLVNNRGGFGTAGAIYNDGGSGGIAANLTVVGSTLNGNATTNSGGAIYNYGYKGTAYLVINRSTICSNTAAGNGSVGGGIFNDGTSGLASLSLNSSTLTGNSAAQYGGGVYNSAPANGNAPAPITACTFVNNSASFGGAIFNNAVGGTATVTIASCILKAGATGANLATSGGALTSQGYNLCSDSGGGLLTGTADQTSADPLLGPLADNGGPTLTHALLPGSPAIDKGRSFGLTTDQRGATRPLDFSNFPNAAGGDGADSGAFEIGAPPLAIAKPGTSVVLSWPSFYTTFSLQVSTNVAESNSWTSATGSAALTGNEFRQTNSVSTTNRFYRLKQN
jgi:hypothetical protein